MSGSLKPRDAREAREWYCAASFTPARYGPSLRDRTRQPITREWVADMLARAVADGYQPEPMRIQYEHQRTPAEQARIDRAIAYINDLAGTTATRSRHGGRIEER